MHFYSFISVYFKIVVSEIASRLSVGFLHISTCEKEIVAENNVK